MVVTERLQRVDQLGSYIYSLCRGKDTFKLQRRDHILGTFLVFFSGLQAASQCWTRVGAAASVALAGLACF